MQEAQILNIKNISNLKVYNVLQSEWYPNDINGNLKHIHTRKLCMHDLSCLRNKWETHLPLKTGVSIMQTEYRFFISRKQVLLQQIKYIKEFIHSNTLQNKYFCKQIFL